MDSHLIPVGISITRCKGLRSVQLRPHQLLLNESSLFPIMQESRLTVALDKRFDDIEEIKDVANYGCGGGVSGFIYYYETREFFNEYEEEIEQELSEQLGDDWMKVLVGHKDVHNTMTFKNHCVWIVVETYCQCKSEEWNESKIISKLST